MSAEPRSFVYWNLAELCGVVHGWMAIDSTGSNADSEKPSVFRILVREALRVRAMAMIIIRIRCMRCVNSDGVGLRSGDAMQERSFSCDDAEGIAVQVYGATCF